MKALFNVNFVIALVFGLAFIIIPATILNLYGVTLNDQGITIARILGAAIFAVSVVCWYAGKTAEPEFIKGASRGFFVYWLLGAIFLLVAQLNGQMNAGIGWATVVLHIIMFIWYAKPAFSKK